MNVIMPKFSSKIEKYLNLYLEKEIIGVKEQIEIDGLGKAEAKIDSGNDGFNVLCGTNVKEHEGKLSCKTINDKELKDQKIVDMVDIHMGGGNVEERPVIKLNFKFRGKLFKNVPFSISDRTESDCPILIGKKFIKKMDVLIDVNKDSDEMEWESDSEDEQIQPNGYMQGQSYITNPPWDNGAA